MYYSIIHSNLMVFHLMNLEEIISNQSSRIQRLESELSIYQKRCEQYMQAYDSLQHQLKELSRHRFGKRSERFVDDPENPQLSLLQNNASLFATTEAASETMETEIQVPAHSRKKKPKSNKELPRRIVIIPLAEEKKHCPCGAGKEVIRYEPKESIHYQPCILEILEQRREVAVCPRGCDDSIVTAPVPLHILPKVKATEEFLSFLVVSKLEDRQPLYHLQKQLSQRHGIDCSRQTMAH